MKDRWEAIKSGERAEKNQIGALQDVPLALPALSRAQKLQRAARVGFDWLSRVAPSQKLMKSIGREALAEGDAGHIESELGIFSRASEPCTTSRRRCRVVAPTRQYALGRALN